MSSSLFICHSTYALACAQYLVRQGKFTKPVLIFAGGKIPGDSSFDSHLWFNIHKIQYTGKRIIDMRALFSAYKYYSVGDLYVSNVNDISERVIVSDHQGKIFLIDDGLAAIQFEKRGIAPYFFENSSIYLKLKFYIFKLLLRAFYGVNIVGVSGYQKKITSFITSFPIKSKEFNLKFIPYPFTPPTKPNRIIGTVFFLGGRLYSNKIISITDYYHLVRSIQKYYDEKNFRFLYFPHPREYNVPNDLEDVSIRIDMGFEQYLCENTKDCPEIISSFSSTALFVLYAINYPSHYEAWEVPEKFRTQGDIVVSEWFRKHGIMIKNVAVNSVYYSEESQ